MVALFTLILAALLPVMFAVSCEQIPLSFSTSQTLYRGNVRDPVGVVTATLSGDTLSVEYTLTDTTCVLTGDVHIELVNTDDPLGISSIPNPGRFSCVQPASGTQTSSHDCPFDSFQELSDCCASTFRLFIHGNVDCSGNLDTVYAGERLCTTNRWCNFQDVDVTAACDLCNACSTDDAACVPVQNGPVQGCNENVCVSDVLPGQRQCVGGSCKVVESSTCETCNLCSEDSKQCEPAFEGQSIEGCSEKSCISESQPGIEQCQSGTCETVSLTECTPCNQCSDSTFECAPAFEGMSVQGCNANVCVSSSVPGVQECSEGDCIVASQAACPTCNECSEESGLCEAAFEGLSVDGCDTKSCLTPIQPAIQQCLGGSCETTPVETCDTCNGCSETTFDCQPTSEGLSVTGCDASVCVTPTIPGIEQCVEGSCTVVNQTACSACQQCSDASASCEAAFEGQSVDGCNAKSCLSLTQPAIQQCTGGSCETTPVETCDTCNECSDTTFECEPASEGLSVTGCNGNVCVTSALPGVEQCVGGSCTVVNQTTCSACQECSEASGACEAAFEGTSVPGCEAKSCKSSTQPAIQQCVGGECVDTDVDACDTCNECSDSTFECEAVSDGSSVTGCDANVCVTSTIPGVEQCVGGACTVVNQTTCAVCQECSDASGVCEAAFDGTSVPGCGTKSCKSLVQPAVQQCSGGVCVETDLTACEICNTCSEVSNECEPAFEGESVPGCNGASCITPSLPGVNQCINGQCASVDGTACDTCKSCVNGVCEAVEDGSTPDDCIGNACFDSTTLGSKMCESGECVISATTECSPCNMCDPSAIECQFDASSPSLEICPTCGQQCTLQGDGTGLCAGSCAIDETCQPGIVDDQDSCVPSTSCQTDTDCESNEDCIENTCVLSSECTAEKEKLCDEVYKDLGSTGSNAGKCCPSTSACVKDTLMLGQNSVCSTECGSACSLTTTTSQGVTEVYCKFGNSTSAKLEGSNLPSCTSLQDNIPNDCATLDVC